VMEWALLVVLIPAIVIPIVLLFGFAGCQLVFPLKDNPVFPGTVSAEVGSRSAITVRWEYTGMEAARFEVRRKRSLDATFELVSPPAFTESEFTDTGLDEDTSYDFRVIAIIGSEPTGPGEVTAVTFGKVFEATLPAEVAGPNRGVVQRIEPARLARSGSRVQLTLQRPSGGALIINRLSLSHAAAAGDPYDSAGPPALLVDAADPLFIPADPAAGTLELPAIDFALDQTRPLLVAFDVGGVGQVRLLTGVSFSEATTFAAPPGVQEAAIADRQTGYTAINSITLIQRIDAG